MSHLRPDRHPQADFFIADILDANPRDDMASMEHPLFALQTGDRRVLHYEHRGSVLEIQPGAKGRATQHDKDILIYCISQIMAARERGRGDVTRRVRLTAYDLLVSTNRRTDGDAYRRLQEALDRLAGTRISTNIKTNGKRERSGFGLIDRYHIVEYDDRERMAALEIDLSEWLWRAIQSGHVLSLSRDYFRLRKPLDRRIYELVRKHCGQQRRWRVSIEVLYRKTGSRAPIRNFRQAVRSLAESGQLPGYRLRYDSQNDTLTAYAYGSKGALAQIQDTLNSSGGQDPSDLFSG
jgi:plasmid replication initiation protein